MLPKRPNICFIPAAVSVLLVLAGCVPAAAPALPQGTNTPVPMPSATGAPVTTLLPLPTLATPLVQPATPFVEPTPTPPPFPVIVIATSIYNPGVPAEEGYAFANPEDLRAARKAYEQYFELLSFRDAPPPPIDELQVQVAELRDLNPNPALNVGLSGRECSIGDVFSVIQRAEEAGQYYRIDAEPLVWSDDHIFLRLTSSGVSLHTDWKANALVQLLERDTSRMIREKQMALLGTASLTIEDGKWIVVGESNGFYCDQIDSFNR
jgi:hypothetical protein